MSDNKIEEIRARHSRDDRWRNTLPQMHEDRATLLAEVDRLRAEIERLRDALGGIRIDGPDADGLVWAIIQHPDIAVRSHVAVYPVGKTIRYLCSNLPDGRILLEPEVEECAPELERHRAEIERLREVIRTIRARCVELDDSDAVSETLDIATAVLEDEP
jgi:hypothetical protein